MHKLLLLVLLVSVIFGAIPSFAATLKIILPLGRVAYQTNEWIDVSVVRGDPNGLAAGMLSLSLQGELGDKLDFAFPIRAVAAPGTATEHYHLNGALLRPSNYLLTVTADGTEVETPIEIYSHIRKSSFKFIDWSSRAEKTDQAVFGEDSIGFNLNYAAYGGLAPDEVIRGGMDYMWCCTMSGGSQMDLRRECDWSDPLVVNGGVARVAKRALMDRTKPNCLGVHLYDEPTLTRWKDPATNEDTHFNVPAQDWGYEAAFAEEPIQYNAVDPKNPQDVERFTEMNTWRLSLMDAAWKRAARAISDVQPNFITANQGSWLFSGFGAGYYFNYQRSLPVYSGHGGYDYLYGGLFAPSYFYELGRMRDYRKPQWYLPTWYCLNPDTFRAEQYMSFQCNLQGMAKPPDLLAHRPSKTPAIAGIVESNKLMAKLGTIFTTMPVTKPEVAVLYSISHSLHNLAFDKKDTYYGDGQFNKLKYVYMAMKQLQIPIFPVVEEDVLDGTLARDHRVVILAGTNYLPDDVIRGLEDFAADRGTVLLSEDSKVQIKGAVRFSMPAGFLDLAVNWDQWAAKGQWEFWNDAWMRSAAYQEAGKLAAILQDKFQMIRGRAGIEPVFYCDQPGIMATRQAQGDIEYLFAVNATPNIARFNWLRGVEAHIALPNANNRPVYDAVNGGVASFVTPDQHVNRQTGTFRFGPGQMRVFARTARPIGGVRLQKPEVNSDLSSTDAPAITLNITATLVDDQDKVLSGAAPLRIRVVDPMGVVRYDLYRATDHGICRLNLPLAANDPGGQWAIFANELLANTPYASISFSRYFEPRQCGAVAGATQRAVIFSSDRENIYRFFRRQRAVTIVTGTSDYNAAAAERLMAILKPWNVDATVVKAADVNKPRELTEEEAKTWVGIGFGRAESGGKNNPDKVGFAVKGPVILLGTPEDNPLIKFLRDQQVLPYAPSREFPGPSRGMLAWQTEMIGLGQESVACIAYDAAGMSEAVGTLYELAAGIDPLTSYALPSSSRLQPATQPVKELPIATTVWQAALPDRIAAVKTLQNGDLLFLSLDGTIARYGATGKLRWQKGFNDGETWVMDATTDGRLIVLGSANRVLALDGNGKVLFDRPLANWKFPPAVSLVAIAPDGKRVLVSGGRMFWEGGWHWGGKMLLLSDKGDLLWEMGGPDPADPKKELLPANFTAGLFTADGSRFALFSEKSAEIRETATGKVLSTLADVSNKVTPLLLNGDRVLAEKKGTVVEITLADGTIQRTLALPANTDVVTLAQAADGIVVGTEGDSAVRLVKSPEGKLADAALWQDVKHTRIVKQVITRGNMVAVAYWGGGLRLLANGKPVAMQQLDQDITAIAWSGNLLIVTLADGRVMAMKVG